MDYAGILNRLGNGKFVQDLCEALATTGAEVVATRNSGTVTVTLTLSPAPGGVDEVMILVNDKIKRSAPSAKPGGAYFYALDGELHREDPRQTRMELRAVDGQSELRIPEDRGSALKEIA